MTLFQLIMLAAAAFFAYQIYVYIQNIDEEAEPAFMQSPEPLPPTPDALVEDADEAFRNGDLQRAKTVLEGCVQEFPDFVEGMNKLAFVLAKLDHKEDALQYYTASLELEPNDDMSHNAIASLLSSMDRNEEAQEHYKKAIEIDDNYEVTWFNYANLMLKLGRHDEAKTMYEKVLSIDPEFQAAQYELEKLA
jgi:tetratricopeptide (TPR) repeat protein